MRTSPCGKKLIPFEQNGTKVICYWGTNRSILHSCEECGYLTFEPLPLNSDLQSYYEKSYWEQTNVINEAKEVYESPYHNEAANLIVNIWMENNYVLDQLFVHEIGCGIGATVNFLNKLGVDSTGSDLSKSAIKIAKQLGNHNVYLASLGDFLKGRPNKKINFFYASHSLEHFRDPIELISLVFAKLEPGGYFLVRVPNSMHITSRLKSFYDYTWLQYPDHLHYFSPQSSICLFENLGFDVKNIETLAREDFPQLMISSLFGKSINEFPDPKSIINAFCNNWLGMELQILLQKPADKKKESSLKEKTKKFEMNACEIKHPTILSGDNAESFNPNYDSDSLWKYFEIESGKLIPLKISSDSKKLVGHSVSVNGSEIFIPVNSTLRIQYLIRGKPHENAILKTLISTNLPYDDNGEYAITVTANDNIILRQSLLTSKYYTFELYTDVNEENHLIFDLNTVRSQWPSIKFHVKNQWIKIQ